jgi:hypothetical protein
MRYLLNAYGVHYGLPFIERPRALDDNVYVRARMSAVSILRPSQGKLAYVAGDADECRNLATSGNRLRGVATVLERISIAFRRSR